MSDQQRTKTCVANVFQTETKTCIMKCQYWQICASMQRAKQQVCSDHKAAIHSWFPTQLTGECDRQRLSDWPATARHSSFRHAHARTRLSRTTQVSRYQNGKTNLDFTEARDSEWQRHQLGRMQVCTSLQTDNHASTPPLSFTGRPTNSVKALRA